jgi:hypothetical protein
LVNRFEAEARGSCQGPLADHLCRLNFVSLGKLHSLPCAEIGVQLLSQLISRHYEPSWLVMATNFAFRA